MNCKLGLPVLIAFAFVLPAAAEEASAVPGGITPELARSLVDEVSAEVERVRGLPFKREVPVAVIDDDEARERMLARLNEFGTLEDVEPISRAYQLLGLLEPGTDLLETILEVLRTQVAGFYDPGQGSYFLLQDMPALMADAITAHELTHALEDQYFDLDERIRKARADDDLLFSQSAVHEGSAMIVMMKFTMSSALVQEELDPEAQRAMQELQAEQVETLRTIPGILIRQLMGPYVLGPAFLLRGNLLGAAADYPVEDAARAYEDGPVSSEQILHPEKYWDAKQRDEPRVIALDGVGETLGDDWTRSYSGTLGEVTLAAVTGASTTEDMLVPFVSRADSWTNEAAAGWDGDRWELWSRGEQALVLVGTVWDSAADAREFAAALADRPGIHATVRGDRVAVVAGEADERLRSGLLKRLLAASKKAR